MNGLFNPNYRLLNHNCGNYRGHFIFHRPFAHNQLIDVDSCQFATVLCGRSHVPITRDQFDQGVSDLETKVLAFLAVTPNKAFSVNEIADGMGWKGEPDSARSGLPDVTDEHGLEKALDDLVNHGLADRKEIDGVNYFSARRH